MTVAGAFGWKVTCLTEDIPSDDLAAGLAVYASLIVWCFIGFVQRFGLFGVMGPFITCRAVRYSSGDAADYIGLCARTVA